MPFAFGRVRRRIAPLRTGFLLMRNGYSEMVSVKEVSADPIVS